MLIANIKETIVLDLRKTIGCILVMIIYWNIEQSEGGTMLEIFDGDDICAMQDEINKYAEENNTRIISVSISTAYRNIGASNVQKLHYTIAVVFDNK